MILLTGLYQYESLRTFYDRTYTCNRIDSAQHFGAQEIYENTKVPELTGATDKI